MKITTSLAFAAAVMLATPARADETPQAAVALKTITELQFYTRQQALDAPRGQSISRAADNGAAGQATLTCHIANDLQVDMCIVLRESPPGHDYGRLVAFDLLRKAKGDSASDRWSKLTVRFGQP